MWLGLYRLVGSFAFLSAVAGLKERKGDWNNEEGDGNTTMGILRMLVLTLSECESLKRSLSSIAFNESQSQRLV